MGHPPKSSGFAWSASLRRFPTTSTTASLLVRCLMRYGRSGNTPLSECCTRKRAGPCVVTAGASPSWRVMVRFSSKLSSTTGLIISANRQEFLSGRTMQIPTPKSGQRQGVRDKSTARARAGKQYPTEHMFHWPRGVVRLRTQHAPVESAFRFGVSP